ncbi:hypothetical protein [Mucilaginibacter sp. R-33]|uniref:hypothetical protein n=1 Tax=Mucilaginibacter sp. R-33 TaxID=3416711 RepID=UPI003CE70AC6
MITKRVSPRVFPFAINLDATEKAAELWQLFNKPFKHSINWKLSFFDFLNDSLVSANYTINYCKPLTELTPRLSFFLKA